MNQLSANLAVHVARGGRPADMIVRVGQRGGTVFMNMNHERALAREHGTSAATHLSPLSETQGQPEPLAGLTWPRKHRAATARVPPQYEALRLQEDVIMDAGNRMWNVVPWPSGVSTSMRPPASCTILWQTDRPRPVPSGPFVV